MNKIKLSKLVSYILRHKPEEYDITLDSEGWVEIGELIHQISKRHKHFNGIDHQIFEEITKSSGKQRFEIKADRIRAFYGHSIESKIAREQTCPPQVLFHGTPNQTASIILLEGLKAMNRQNVHLSSDKKTAEVVAKRWHSEYQILKVDAKKAFNDGIAFYKGNENIWLADFITQQYISE
jgi:putative RNA 2'-phosphotransferase